LPTLQNVSKNSLYNRDALPLFADDVWPGARVLADHLTRPDVLAEHVVNRRVVELGAGAALPGVVAACLGAQFVCACDYPADGIVENINAVLLHNRIPAEKAAAMGYAWGAPTDALQELGGGGKYHTALMAELFWKDTVGLHSELLTSLCNLLELGGVAIAAFAHRPSVTHFPAADLNFFKLAAQAGFVVEYLPSVQKYADVGEIDPIVVQVIQMKRIS
jgi:predicted nicotinamide N-methyase